MTDKAIFIRFMNIFKKLYIFDQEAHDYLCAKEPKKALFLIEKLFDSLDHEKALAVLHKFVDSLKEKNGSIH